MRFEIKSHACKFVPYTTLAHHVHVMLSNPHMGPCMAKMMQDGNHNVLCISTKNGHHLDFAQDSISYPESLLKDNTRHSMYTTNLWCNG